MGVVTYDYEVTSHLPPHKLFKAFILDSDKIIPKIKPEHIKSIEYEHGDGGVGTIKKISFAEGAHFKFVKHHVDALDKEKHFYAYSLVEGDVLGDKLEKISYEVKVEEGHGGGSIVKNHSKYYTIGHHEIKEEEIKGGKDKAIGLFHAIEAYVGEHPEEY